MGNKFIVNVKSELPPSSAEWIVDNGDDPKMALIYTNLGYDLIAAAMMKLGVEYSKLILGEQSEAQFNTTMGGVQEALKAGTVAG